MTDKKVRVTWDAPLAANRKQVERERERCRGEIRRHTDAQIKDADGKPLWCQVCNQPCPCPGGLQAVHELNLWRAAILRSVPKAWSVPLHERQ